MEYGHPKILKIYKVIAVAKWIPAKEEKKKCKEKRVGRNSRPVAAAILNMK